MKTVTSILVLFALVLTMSACELPHLTESSGKSTEATNAETTAATEPSQTAEPNDTTEPSDPTESSDDAELPYLQKIKRADQPIYNGPGYDYNQVGTAEVSGTYTIVNEQVDQEGNLWGKLKSGAGWVDLTQINTENDNPPLVTISIPSKTLLESEQYHHCIADTSEYMVQVAFRVRESVSEVALYEVVFNGSEESLTPVYTLDVWDTDMPIVADIAFPGDLSMYEFHLTDSAGKQHRYTIYESGRNGEIYLESGSILD